MPIAGVITSLQNPRVRAVERLKRKKRDRYREQQYVVEGYRLVHHALSRGYRPALAFYTEGFAASEQGGELVRALVAGEAPVWEVSSQVLEALADTVTPQGVVAVFSMRLPSPEQVRQAELLLVLDALRTPGNVGTILRTAQATGAGAVLCAPGTVDPYSPKAVRSGMGAHLDLALVVDVSWEHIATLIQGRRVFAAAADGDAVLWDEDLTGPVALIIGSEAHGVGAHGRALAQNGLRIPMAESAESLNAAIAASALLFEAQRQRWQAAL